MLVVKLQTLCPALGSSWSRIELDIFSLCFSFYPLDSEEARPQNTQWGLPPQQPGYGHPQKGREPRRWEAFPLETHSLACTGDPQHQRVGASPLFLPSFFSWPRTVNIERDSVIILSFHSWVTEYPLMPGVCSASGLVKRWTHRKCSGCVSGCWDYWTLTIFLLLVDLPNARSYA